MPLLPFPKAREIWSAQSGRRFFFKWMIAAGLGALFKSAWIWMTLVTTRRPWQVSDLLYYCIPILIQFWVLFGFRWRLWVWLGFDIASAFLLGFGARLVSVGVRAGWQTLLLIGIRRRPAIWILAFFGAQAFEYANMRVGPLRDLTNASIDSIPVGMLGKFWVRLQVSHAVEFLMAAILGAALAWLMPPSKSDQKPAPLPQEDATA